MNVYGCEEILALDGARGLEFVARTLGGFLADDPSFWVDELLCETFDEVHGDGEAEQLLDELAQDDPLIARYQQAVASTLRARARSATTPDESKSRIVEKIEASGDKLVVTSIWGRQASVDELDALLAVALSNSSPITIANSLQCISGSSSYPLKHELMPYLEHEDEDVRSCSARILGRHADKRVRELGLARLSSDLGLALMLLRSNARAEDAEQLCAALAPVEDIGLQHQLVSDLVQVLQDCPGVVEPRLALYVYEQSPCAKCRLHAVEKLVQWDRVPIWLRDEARFDGDEDVRGLFGDGFGAKRELSPDAPAP